MRLPYPQAPFTWKQSDQTVWNSLIQSLNLRDRGIDNQFQLIRSQTTTGGGAATTVSWGNLDNAPTFTPIYKAVKTDNTTISASNTRVNDPHLQVTLTPGFYAGRIQLLTRSHAAADLTWQATISGGSGVLWIALDQNSNAVTPFGVGSSQNIAGAGVSATRSGVYNASLEVIATTAFKVKWAQQTVTAVDSILVKGSYIIFTNL